MGLFFGKTFLFSRLSLTITKNWTGLQCVAPAGTLRTSLSQRIHFCPPAHHVGPWAPPQGRDVSAHHHRRPQQEGRGQAMEPRQGARKGARAAPRLAATGAAEPSRQAPLGPQPSSLRVPGQPPCPRGSPVSLGDAPRVGGGLRLSPAAVAWPLPARLHPRREASQLATR